MADISKLFLNWSELDRSITSAIAATQAARAIFDDARQKTPELRPARTTQPGAGRHMRHSPKEVVSTCFEEAEWLLGEARARMMIARAAAAGFSRIPTDTYLRPPISAVSIMSAISARLAAGASACRTMSGAAVSVSNATSTAFNRKIAKIFRIWVHRLIALMRNAKAGVRRRWWHYENAFSETGLLSLGAARVIKTRISCADQKGVLRVAVLSAGAAFAVWMLAPGMTSSSPAAPVIGAAADDPALAKLEGYPTSSCTVAAWGKACYPRRPKP